MTTVIIYRNSNQEYKGFVCMGHADFAKKRLFSKEPDILCASISTLVINTINAFEELAGEADKLSVTTNVETGFIKCDFNSSINEKAVLLLEAMILGLNTLEKDYGEKYLQVKFEEV